MAVQYRSTRARAHTHTHTHTPVLWVEYPCTVLGILLAQERLTVQFWVAAATAAKPSATGLLPVSVSAADAADDAYIRAIVAHRRRLAQVRVCVRASGCVWSAHQDQRRQHPQSHAAAVEQRVRRAP